MPATTETKPRPHVEWALNDTAQGTHVRNAIEYCLELEAALKRIRDLAKDDHTLIRNIADEALRKSTTSD